VAASFSAHLEELDILLEDLGLGRFVYPYEVPSVGTTLAARAEHREHTWQRLRENGLAGRNGLVPDADELLRAWVAPQVQLTQVATVVEQGTRYLYRGGWHGKLGFLSRQDGETLVFEELRPEQVVPEMVAFLPGWPALRAHPVTITEAAPAHRTTSEGEQSQIIDSGDDGQSPDLRAVERFFAAPMLRFGIISCSSRVPGNSVHVSRERPRGSLAWFDTTEGRFCQASEDLRDGSKRRTYFPADSRRIAQWLRERLSVEVG
jgi:hypothetical protein